MMVSDDTSPTPMAHVVQSMFINNMNPDEIRDSFIKAKQAAVKLIHPKKSNNNQPSR